MNLIEQQRKMFDDNYPCTVRVVYASGRETTVSFESLEAYSNEMLSKRPWVLGYYFGNNGKTLPVYVTKSQVEYQKVIKQ